MHMDQTPQLNTSTYHIEFTLNTKARVGGRGKSSKRYPMKTLNKKLPVAVLMSDKVDFP